MIDITVPTIGDEPPELFRIQDVHTPADSLTLVPGGHDRILIVCRDGDQVTAIALDRADRARRVRDWPDLCTIAPEPNWADIPWRERYTP